MSRYSLSQGYSSGAGSAPDPRFAARHARATPTQARVGLFDTARGLSVALMIAAAAMAVAPGDNPNLAGASRFLATFAAPTFFLLAGVFLHRAMHMSIVEYLARKVASLVWLYALFACAGLVFALWLKAPLTVAMVFAAASRVLLDPPPMLVAVCVLALAFAAIRLTRGLPVLIMLPIAAALEIAQQRAWGPIPAEFCRLFVYLYVGHAFAPEIRSLARHAAANASHALGFAFAWAFMNLAAIAIKLPMAGGAFATLPFASLGLGLFGAGAMIAIAALIDGAQEATPARWVGERALAVYLAAFAPVEALRVSAYAIPWSGWSIAAFGLCAAGLGIVALALAQRDPAR